MTKEEALERTHALIAGWVISSAPDYGESVIDRRRLVKNIAHALLCADREVRIDELRRMARKRCDWCREHWIHIDKLFIIHGDTRNGKKYIKMCLASPEHRRIAVLENLTR